MGLQVKWGVLVALTVGLLLTVPLLLALGTVFHPVHESEPRGDARVSPVLSWAEGRRLVTFEKPCETQADCEPPLGCMQLNPGDISLCMASECMTDVQCEEGFTCQTFTTRDGGPLVRFCAPVGRKKEGEPCLQGLGVRNRACAEGLICTGWCGRRCELDAPESCPEGFYCKQGLDGPSCRPTCEGRACPEGQQCIPFDGRTSVCAEVRGQDCQHTPCPEGQQCKRYYPRQRPQGLVLRMECVQPCAEGSPPCPEGLACASGECRRPCTPDTPGACGPDEVCRLNPLQNRAWCQLRTRP